MSVKLAEINSVLEHSQCLLDENGVNTLFQRLATEITERCQFSNPVVLCVMTGAIVAVGQLLPKLNFPLEVDYIHATRYQGELVGSDLVWKQLPSIDLTDRTVIIIDDVLDEGITMAQVKSYCVEQGAKVCYLAVLVDKKIQQKKPAMADFVGYQADNEYLFGLGMDYKGYWRNLNGLYACPSNVDELLSQC